MIFEGSRYASADVVAVESDGHFRRMVIENPPYATRFPALNVITEEHDRIDLLADQFYEDPEMWWLIAYANPEIHVWDPLPVNVRLRIPRVPSLR